MASPVKVEVTFDMNLARQAQRRINSAFTAAVRDLLADEILPEAQAASPRDTGENADTMAGKVRWNGSKQTVVGTVFTQSGHGGYLERGTVKMPARPYLFPAFQRALPKLQALIHRRVEQMKEFDVLNNSYDLGALAAALKSGKWRPTRRRNKK